MDKSRMQLNQLCQSFQLLFQKLKDNRNHKLEIEKSNQQLQALIEAERNKRLENEGILEQEKDQLEKQLKQVQEILEAYQSTINVSASQQKVLVEEKQNLEENLKQKEAIIHEKMQQQSFLQEEINILCRQMSLINGNEKDMDSEVQQQLNNLEQQKNKLNEMLAKVQDADNLQVSLTQEKDAMELKYKTVQRELALTIKSNAQVQSKIKDYTKVFEKLSQQLNSKMERLNTQYKHNDQLNQQVKKLENLKLSQQRFQQQNSNSMNQIDQVGQSSQFMKSLSPNSRLKYSQQKQVQQIQQQQQDEKKSRINDYKLQLSQQLDYYKNQIEQYDSVINSLQIDIDNLQSQFEQYTFIPQDQLIQLFQQHFLTQNTNQDDQQIQQNQEHYNNGGDDEDDDGQQDELNHLQQANYETFSQRNDNNQLTPSEDDHLIRNIQTNSQLNTQQNNYSDGILQHDHDEEEVI